MPRSAFRRWWSVTPTAVSSALICTSPSSTRRNRPPENWQQLRGIEAAVDLLVQPLTPDSVFLLYSRWSGWGEEGVLEPTSLGSWLLLRTRKLVWTTFKTWSFWVCRHLGTWRTGQRRQQPQTNDPRPNRRSNQGFLNKTNTTRLMRKKRRNGDVTRWIWSKFCALDEFICWIFCVNNYRAYRSVNLLPCFCRFSQICQEN